MLFKSSTLALALAFTSLVSAQTSSDCNPTKEKGCPNDPAVGKNGLKHDFAKDGASKTLESLGSKVTYDGTNGAVFSLKVDKDAQTLRTPEYFFYGTAEVWLQCARGKGIVSSIVLQSDDLDEIDWECVGALDNMIQTNYFSKGQNIYGRGRNETVEAPFTTFHNYTIEWTAEKITWYIDGRATRVVTAAEAGAEFPQTPMQLRIGIWMAGSKNAPEGTANWAGGYTDLNEAPFTGYYKSIKIVDYGGKNGPTSESIKEYRYKDQTGSRDSIEIVKGEKESNEDKSDEDKSDEDKSDEDKSDKDHTDKDHTDKDQTGKDQTDKDQTDKDQTGKDKSDKDKSKPSSNQNKTSNDTSDSKSKETPASKPPNASSASRAALTLGAVVFAAAFAFAL